MRVAARIKNKLQTSKYLQKLNIGKVTIHFDSQRVFLKNNSNEELVNLSSTEFKIFSYLSMSCDQVISREKIISFVWRDGFHLSDRTIDSHISRIRKKLHGADIQIEAVMNSGYRVSVLSNVKIAA